QAVNDPQSSTRTAPAPSEPADPAGEVVAAPGLVLERPRREPLSRQRIIAAALRIMDEEGLGAGTMRRVGRELGREARSLYNPVRDKDDILDGIAEGVLGEFRFQRAEGDWAESARMAAREFRRLLLAHPGVMTLLTERDKPFTNADSLRVYEYIFDLFRTAGLTAPDAAQAFRVFGGASLASVS